MVGGCRVPGKECCSMPCPQTFQWKPAILSPGLQHQLFTLTSHHLLSCISIHVGTIWGEDSAGQKILLDCVEWKTFQTQSTKSKECSGDHMIAGANAMFVFASVFKGHDFSTKPCLSKGVQTKNPPIFMVPPSRGLKISEGWFGRTRSLMHHKTIASRNIVIPEPHSIHLLFFPMSWTPQVFPFECSASTLGLRDDFFEKLKVTQTHCKHIPSIYLHIFFSHLLSTPVSEPLAGCIGLAPAISCPERETMLGHARKICP